jgi:hypothetical protein
VSENDREVAEAAGNTVHGGRLGTTLTFRVRGAGSNGLNLRSAPGLGSKVVGTLEDGDVVEAEHETWQVSRRTWRCIVRPREGFVSEAFLDTVGTDEAADEAASGAP